MKKYIVLGRVSLFVFALSASFTFAATPNWNITGSWDLHFQVTAGAFGIYDHHMDVVQATDGTLTGTGLYIPASSYTWVIDPGSYVSESNVHVNLHYTGGHPATWTTTFDATIDNSGNLSGTWSDNQGNSGLVASYNGTAKETLIADTCPDGTTQNLLENQTVQSNSTVATPSTNVLANGKK